MSDPANTPGWEWKDADRETADWLERDLRVAFDVPEGQHVEHYVIGVQLGSRQVDGKPRMVLVSTCCRGTSAPTNLMASMMQALGGKN